MDMLYEIAKEVKFDFTIHLSKDGLFGSFEKVSLGRLLKLCAHLVQIKFVTCLEEAANLAKGT